MRICSSSTFFFFNDTATTEIYTLSLHDALPISDSFFAKQSVFPDVPRATRSSSRRARCFSGVLAEQEKHLRSEEHTSELQSQSNLVCRLLLEKKKNCAERNKKQLRTADQI